MRISDWSSDVGSSDLLGARVRWKPSRSRTWRSAPLAEAGGGRWSGEITPDEVGMHDLVVEAWTDRYATWRHEVEVKVGAGQDVTLELEEGALILDDLRSEEHTSELQSLMRISYSVISSA